MNKLCEKCGVFTKGAIRHHNLRAHVLCDSECGECSKTFPTKRRLDDHVRGVHGEKSNLNQHKSNRKHDMTASVSEIECVECKEKFESEQELK